VRGNARRLGGYLYLNAARMNGETDGRDAERQRLRQKWNANEAELHGLADLPTGAVDPTERQRQLEAEHHEIEGQLAAGYIQEDCGEWDLTPRGKQVADAVREMFCRAVGRDPRQLDRQSTGRAALRPDQGPVTAMPEVPTRPPTP
jgi:hypothetical protein